MLTKLALLTLAALISWWAGGLVLRVGGTVLVVTGLLITALGSAPGLLVFAIRTGLWLAGQIHHVIRHHAFQSPLARRMLTQLLPERLDPTRAWAIATTTAERRPGPGT